MNRRNLSGFYIFEKFNGEKKRQPTCFEDCTIETRDKFLDSLSREGLQSMVVSLGETLREIGEQFKIYNGGGDDEENN